MKILYKISESKSKGKETELIRFNTQVFNEKMENRNSHWKIETKEFDGMLVKKNKEYALLIKNKPITIKRNFMLLLEDKTIDGLKWALEDEMEEVTFPIGEFQKRLNQLDLITIFGETAKEVSAKDMEPEPDD